jgi:hypothetical protein
MERREAPAFSKRERGKTERLVRHSVLHPLDCRGGRLVPAKAGKEVRLPGAIKNTGSEALAV